MDLIDPKPVPRIRMEHGPRHRSAADPPVFGTPGGLFHETPLSPMLDGHFTFPRSDLPKPISMLALNAENVLPFPAVNSLFIPWDFVLILVFLGAIIPWSGVARMKRLLSKPELTTGDRLSLYGSTIFFQWLIAAILAWRCAERAVGPEELGITIGVQGRVVLTSFVLTGILCLNQLVGLGRIARMPGSERGPLFAITEKIAPRTATETLVYAALCCTAGVSEEFLYRGFAFMAFLRMIVNFGPPNAGAALLSSAWFALAHLYQGRRGVITTFVVGLIFVWVRIWTGSLIPAVAAHIGIDLVVGIGVSRFLQKA
jgi:membrane protease YdiL (CAAX protease family)